jgi:hypothetical protein
MALGIDRQIQAIETKIKEAYDSRGHRKISLQEFIALKKQLSDLKKQRAENMGKK